MSIRFNSARPSDGRHRSRWAAIGAAVAVSLGAGTLAVTQAASGDGDPSNFVPISPCRLADTRPASNVGPFATPIGPDESRDLMAHGVNGDCEIPTSATALAVNVTALNATEVTYFTMHPADQPAPTAANLNPSPGEPPTPNYASVTLATDGEGDFSLYNFVGTVDYVIDVAGYYVVDDAAPPAAAAATLAEGTLPAPHQKTVTNMQTDVVTVEISTPSAGKVLVDSAVTIDDDDAGETTSCQIASAGFDQFGRVQSWQSSGGGDGKFGNLSGTRIFEVDGSAESLTATLVCTVGGGADSTAVNPVLTATFFPGAG